MCARFLEAAQSGKGKEMLNNLCATARGMHCHLARHFNQTALLIPDAEYASHKDANSIVLVLGTAGLGQNWH